VAGSSPFGGARPPLSRARAATEQHDRHDAPEEHRHAPDAEFARQANAPELPDARSGKIRRRLLRDVAERRTLGDTTTLADPAVAEEIKERATADSRED
jgi:hypothetical protein